MAFIHGVSTDGDFLYRAKPAVTWSRHGFYVFVSEKPLELRRLLQQVSGTVDPFQPRPPGERYQGIHVSFENIFTFSRYSPSTAIRIKF